MDLWSFKSIDKKTNLHHDILSCQLFVEKIIVVDQISLALFWMKYFGGH